MLNHWLGYALCAVFSGLSVGCFYMAARTLLDERDAPGRNPAPPVNPPPYQYEPSRAEIVQAYCHMRGFVPEWRSDHGMFALRKPGMAPLHGFAIYVTPWTNLAGWLNAMDAYECGNRLRPELEPDTLSVQNIDPSNGAGSQV